MEKLILNIISLIATYYSYQHICISHKGLTLGLKVMGEKNWPKDMDYVKVKVEIFYKVVYARYEESIIFQKERMHVHIEKEGLFHGQWQH